MFEGRVQVSLTDDRIRINRPSQLDSTPSTKEQSNHPNVGKYKYEKQIIDVWFDILKNHVLYF